MNLVADGVVVGLRKGSGRMTKTLTEMPKVGDKVRYVGGLDDENISDITEGFTYRIEGLVSDGGVYYVDDVGDKWRIDSYGLDYYELVTEPQPDVRDLIANLGRRLHEVEQAQAKAAQDFSCDFGYDADVQFVGDKTRITVTFDDLISGDDAIDRTIDVMKEWKNL